MNIFLTGGTGFIGSYILSQLLNGQHRVTMLVRDKDKADYYVNDNRIRIIEGDISDWDIVSQSLEEQDAVIHTALNWGDSAVEMVKKDTLSSVHLFETAAQKGVKKIIYTSSSTAIGDLKNIMTESTCTRPDNYYSATKAATESFLMAIAKQYAINSHIIRPGYVFGNPIIPAGRMEPNNRFRDIVQKAVKNEDIHLIKNDGTQFIWAGDLASVYVKLLEADSTRLIFHAMSKDYITWEDIARYAIEYTKSSSSIFLEDLGWSKGGCIYSVNSIKMKLESEFFPFEKIQDHIIFLADNCYT